MKKLLSLLLCSLLLVGICPWASAAEDRVGAASAGAYSLPSEEETGIEDCEDGAAALTLRDLSAYKHSEVYANRIVCKGVDVSVFQGDIDWAAVKADGVDFVILRLGGRYSRSGAFYTDSNFEKNISGALAQGLEVGVYYFSQAISEEEAKQEAAEALRILGDHGAELSLPVYLDTEYVDGGRLYDAGLTKAEQTAVAEAFCSEIEKAGLNAGVYAAFCSFNIDAAALAAAGYELWLAQWNSEATMDPIYTAWQFSDQGTVSGIRGNVDFDFRYKSIPVLTATVTQRATGFSDVSVTDWFCDSVIYVTDKGYFNGVGDGKFNPSGTMTREMFATVLYRLAGEAPVAEKSGFSDITDPDAWYYSAVVWGAESGLINGVKEKIFGLGQKLTRQEMVTLLWRYAGECGLETESGRDLSGFADGDEVVVWAEAAMCWAVENEIIAGLVSENGDSRLLPAAYTSRAQVAAVLQRFEALLDSGE